MKTLVICIDAFRKDYINSEFTPFLNNFNEKRTLIPSFEYGVSSNFLTGKLPVDNDLWVNFRKSDDSIYRKLCFMKNKKLIELSANMLRFLRKEYFLSGVYEIPFTMLKFFDVQLKRNPYQVNSLKNKTFFDILNNKKKKYLVIDYPYIVTNKSLRIYPFLKKDEKISKKMIKSFSDEINFYYCHLQSIDYLGHKYGPLSKITLKRVQEIDAIIKELVSSFLKKFPDGNIFLFSDHGMVEVKGYVNLEKTKKYCEYYFFDSTIARFWPKNKKEREKLIMHLKKIKCGRILNENDEKKLGINFSHNEFGELFFVLNPGFVIHPDFFHKNKVKGMHTYYKNCKENNGFLITNTKIKINNIKMIDLHKLIKRIILK